ncbi:MAG: glycine--tRNA ligase subunit beta, partial [Proteobacteria bacterium]|nr:glycine--tRNA ligase subunit beta [Pseudomonadota bacterium]
MTELLIEIYSEEIPARMQRKAADDFKKLFIDLFNKQNIKFSEKDLNSYCNPRRLTFVASNLDKSQIVEAKKIVGPNVQAPENAIKGFLKSVGVDDVSKLDKIDNKKGTYYCFETKESKIDTGDILQNNIPATLQKMGSLWSKSMVWLEGENRNVRWVRPIHNILCVFDKKTISFDFASVKSNNKSFGHHFLNSKSFIVTNFKQYEKELKSRSSILDAKEREEIIVSDIKSICKK